MTLEVGIKPRTRQQVLNDCPFLATFINPELQKVEANWSWKINETSRPIDEIMEQTYGPMTTEAAVFAAIGKLKLLNAKRMFSGGELGILAGFAINIFYVGYEVGNLDEAALFADDLAQVLNNLQLLAPGYRPSRDGLGGKFDPMYSLLVRGAEVRKQIATANQSTL